jgi:TM2 domain-containing membrane protein YozV
MDQQMLMMLRGLQPDELQVIQSVTFEMNESQQKQFLLLYQGKRKEEQTMILLTVLGFFGFAGIQRFVIGETLMGILFFFTAGFCLIGTIVDLVNIKGMTYDYNKKQAYEAAAMVNIMTKK